MSDTRHVKNTSGQRIFVPGYGPLDPADTATVEDSDAVRELISAGALHTAKTPPKPAQSRRADHQPEED